MLPADPHHTAKCSALKEQVTRHVEEGRTELFSKARKLLDAEQLESLGEVMQARTVMLQGASGRRAVPSQTAHAARLR